MTTESDILRHEVVDLFQKRKDGSIADRDFQKKSVEKTIALYRSVVRSRLDAEETIESEHHVIEAHTALNRSILKEPEQQATSFFLTNKRLVRLRSTVIGDRPPSCDASDNTLIDEVALSEIKGLVMRRTIREGELISGLVIALFALVFDAWLLFTAKIMLGLGLVGAFHAVVFPNRRLEILLRASKIEEPFVLTKLRTKSARQMRASIDARIGVRREMISTHVSS